MPMILLPIPETTESVTRPVMLDIMRQVMQLTGISSKTNIVYFGDVEKSKQLNSAINSQGDDPNGFAHNEKVQIEVSETFIADRVPGEQIFGPDNYLIFHDAPLNIVMKPVYAQIEALIQVKYRAVSRNQAIQWRDTIKARISQKRNINIHNATYNYGVPLEMLAILQELHRLRENVAGYGVDFDTYFDGLRDPRMTVVTNMSGAAKMWVVPETQTRIQGWFDWELPEEPQRDGPGETHTISFTYKFSYARPDEIAMIYPIMVHNQLLGQKYRDVPLQDHNDLQKAYAFTTRVLENFAGAKGEEGQAVEFGYAIPTFDEFMPQTVPLHSRRLVTVLFTIDPNNPSLFLNLGDLGQKQFSPEILEYMRAEHEYLTKPGMSAINVALYKNEFLIEPNPPAIQVDADLNVIGLSEPNLRVQHHIRVGLLTDLQLLKGGALQRLQDHGQAAIQILQAIDPTLEPRGFMPKLIGDNFVSKTSLLIAINNARPTKSPINGLPNMNHVQVMFVETNHEHNV